MSTVPVVSAADEYPPEPPNGGDDETCQQVPSMSDPSGTYTGQIDSVDDYDYIFRTPVDKGDIIKVTVPPTPYSGDFDVNMRMISTSISDRSAISLVGLTNADSDFSADVPSAVVGVAGDRMTVSFYAEESGVMCLDVDENGEESTVYDWELEVSKNPQITSTGNNDAQTESTPVPDTDEDGVNDTNDYAPRDANVQTEPTPTPVSDTDGDGVNDTNDYAPRDANVQTEPDSTSQTASNEVQRTKSNNSPIAGSIPFLIGAFGLGVGVSWIAHRSRNPVKSETSTGDQASKATETKPWKKKVSKFLDQAEEHRMVANEALADNKNTVAKAGYRDARDAYREALKELEKYEVVSFDIEIKNHRFTSESDIQHRLEKAEERLETIRTGST